MKRNRALKIIGIILVTGIMLQTGILAYANLFGGGAVDDGIDMSSIVISQEILDLIKAQDSLNFDRNVNNYKRMLVILNVHETFKREIERLISAGHKLVDILVAYEFLSDCYGTIDELEGLISAKEGGKSWEEAFEAYTRSNPEFTPRNFEFDYIEDLMQEDGLSADDIMTADRVSQKTGVPFKEVADFRKAGMEWKDINVEYGVVNGQDSIPRVPVTPEQIKKYSSSGQLTEDQVVEALVMACKLRAREEDVIEKVKAGYTREKLFAEYLEERYC